MREGILQGCGDSTPWAGRNFRDKACRNVIIASINDATGLVFIGKAEALLAEHKTDLLFIDPLLAYVGRDISQQEVASQFLREWLTPAIAKQRELRGNHHAPSAQAQTGQGRRQGYRTMPPLRRGEWSCSTGRAAVEVVLELTKRHGIFELRLGKRGRRVGWVEADGQTPSFKRTIGHGENGLIYWRELDEQEATTANAAPGKAKEDLLAVVPMMGPIRKDALISKAQAKGIGEKKARGFIGELLDMELLFEWRTKRAGTNPEISLARVAQSKDE